MNVGNRLKSFRNSKKISGSKLSEFSGITQAYISEIENNKKQPTIYVLEKLCDALDISLSDFFAENVSNESIEFLNLIKLSKNLTTEQLASINQLICSFLKK